MFEITEEEDQMKQYDKGGTCIKCGYSGIEDVHMDEVSQAYADALNRIHRTIFSVGNPNQPCPEHIARTCKNCGYSWREKPLDTVDPDWQSVFFHPDGSPEDVLKRIRKECSRKDDQPDTPEPDDIDLFYSPSGKILLCVNNDKDVIHMYTLSEPRVQGTADYNCTFKKEPGTP